METWAAVISAIVAALALFGWYIERREKNLRRDDVLAWANEAIAELQSVILICALDEDQFGDHGRDRIRQAILQTSILIERGRLFFRNVIKDGHGSEKAEAYRGYRPLILDPLVIAHQVACKWTSAPPHMRRTYAAILESHAKQFVSMVRAEVGRDRTASGGAAVQGMGVHLPLLVAQWNRPDRQREFL